MGESVVFFLGNSPESAHDLCYHIWRNSSTFSFFFFSILLPRPQDPNPSLIAHIPALRPKSLWSKFQPQGQNPTQKTEKNKSSKDRTWSAVPDALLEVIS